MDADEGTGQPAEFQLSLPPEAEAGVFANFAGIWQDDDGFVLDFAAITRAPEPVERDGAARIVVHAKVVSRVRIPPRQALELMRALNAQLTTWEQNHGPVAGPVPDQ